MGRAVASSYSAEYHPVPPRAEHHLGMPRTQQGECVRHCTEFSQLLAQHRILPGVAPQFVFSHKFSCHATHTSACAIIHNWIISGSRRAADRGPQTHCTCLSIL